MDTKRQGYLERARDVREIEKSAHPGLKSQFRTLAVRWEKLAVWDAAHGRKDRGR
jgi:hypothetical protein